MKHSAETPKDEYGHSSDMEGSNDFRNKAPVESVKMPERKARFALGQQVRHRVYDFRGIIFDVDPYFNNTEEWYKGIPAEIRPKKDQPFYHLLAENAEDHSYIAYVSEQNLILDTSTLPLVHEDIQTFFTGTVETGLVTRMLAH